MPKNQQVPISERALFARINRALAKEGETLRRCRPDSRWSNELGYYYALDISRNAITSKHVDLEDWGREMGVLKPYEKLDTNQK